MEYEDVLCPKSSSTPGRVHNVDDHSVSTTPHILRRDLAGLTSMPPVGEYPLPLSVTPESHPRKSRRFLNARTTCGTEARTATPTPAAQIIENLRCHLGSST